MKKMLPYIVTLAVAILITLLVSRYEESVLALSSPSINFSLKRRICDGFFVSGSLILSFGGLIAIAEHGGLDAIRYAFYRMKERFVHPRVEERDNDGYYEYVKSREERKKAPFLHFVVIGALFIALSLALALI